MVQNILYMSEQGIRKLEEELEYLSRVKRKEIAERLHDALEEIGELEDNAAYEAAKSEQAFLEGRIRDIEDVLARARPVRISEGVDGIQIGSTVVIEDDQRNMQEFTIVGAREANPRAGLISYESPLGQALLGRLEGEIVTVNTPSGLLTYTIHRVTYPARAG